MLTKFVLRFYNTNYLKQKLINYVTTYYMLAAKSCLKSKWLIANCKQLQKSRKSLLTLIHIK